MDGAKTPDDRTRDGRQVVDPEPDPAPTEPMYVTPTTVARPRRSPRTSTYDRVGQTIAYGASIAIAIGLWLAGAAFTLAAIDAVGLNTTNLLWWMLPLSITGVEIWLMPQAGSRPGGLAVFALVLAIDVASSWYGILDVLGGRFMPLGPGFTVPKDGMALHIFAVVAALLLAFSPEKLARWAWSELLKVWR